MKSMEVEYDCSSNSQALGRRHLESDTWMHSLKQHLYIVPA